MKKIVLNCLLILIPLLLSSQTFGTKPETHRLLEKAISLREDSSNLERAYEMTQEALKLAIEEEDSLAIGNSYLQQGLIFEAKEEVGSSFLKYQKALQVFSQMGNKERLGSVYNNLSNLKESTGEYYKALDYAHLAIENWSDSSNNDTANLAKPYNSIANIKENLGELDSAIYYNKQAIYIIMNTDTEKENQGVLADAHYGLGNRYGNKGLFIESTIHYEKARQLYDISRDKETIAWIYENIGLNNLSLDKYEEAEESFQVAENILKEMKDSSSLSHLYYNWTQLKRITKDYNKALAYSNLSLSLSKERSGLLRAQIISNIETSIMQERASHDKSVLLFTVFGSGLIILLTFLWNRNKKIRMNLRAAEIREEATRLKTAQALFNTSEALLNEQKTRVELEKRISTIKHDKIKNSAIRVRNLLDTFLKERIDEKIDLNHLIKAKHTTTRIVNYAETPIDRIEEVYNYFKPKALKFFVKEMHQIAQEQSNLMDIRGLDPEDYEDVAYFKVKPEVQSKIIDEIIGNAFDNIGLHAQCQNAYLRIKASSRKLIIEIEDDGKGFEPDMVNEKSSGLKNITRAAQSLSGTAEIESSTGNGTRIKVIIPKPFVE